MRRPVVLAAALALAGGLTGWAVASRSFFSPPTSIVQFGYIRSITPSGTGYLLRLDPAYWLGGLTAERAAAQDGRQVDNDYYILNPDHRLLTYRLPAGAPATVLTNSGGGIRSTRIPIAELAQVVAGRNPKHRPLLETGHVRTLGYWVRTRIDTVTSIDEEYQP